MDSPQGLQENEDEYERICSNCCYTCYVHSGCGGRSQLGGPEARRAQARAKRAEKKEKKIKGGNFGVQSPMWSACILDSCDRLIVCPAEGRLPHIESYPSLNYSTALSF